MEFVSFINFDVKGTYRYPQHLCCVTDVLKLVSQTLYCYLMFLHLTLEFCIRHCLQYCCCLKLRANSHSISSTRPDSGPKVNHSAFKKHMFFLALSMCFFSTERSTFGPDRYWSKDHNMASIKRETKRLKRLQGQVRHHLISSFSS